jgi:hypothetical protein
MDTLEYQIWMDHGLWKIQSTNDASGTPGLGARDDLRFTPAMMIEVRKSGQTNFSVWGKQCEIKDDGLHGITDPDGRPFVVQRDPNTGQLSCDFVAVPIPQQVTSLSIDPKGLIRGAALNARSQPAVSVLSRQATSSNSTAVTPSPGNPNSRLGASATWVADPGGPGEIIRHPWGPGRPGSHQAGTA